MPTATAAEPEAPAAAAAGGGTGRIGWAWERPVAADSVAVFRIAYGLLVAVGSVRFLARGWVDTLYLAPEHHLTYRGFEWVEPLPAPWMHAHLVVLAVLGLCIALGWHHRLATALFLVGFTYTELIEASLYLNHYWFLTLAGVLLLVLPVHHHWSLDAASGRVAPSAVVPAGVVWVLRAQLAVVYVFAGVAKLNADWLVEAQPLRLWLADRTHVGLVGPWLDEPVVAHLASWGGALFDCTIVGWLLWRRSRPWAYAVLVAFHLATAALFQIGLFPWVMIVATLVFFPPDWPRRSAARLARSRAPVDPPDPVDPSLRLRAPVLVALALFALVQLALPLRHYAIPGNVRWTEEGYYLSWRVMLTEKAGFVEFAVTDPATGRVWTVAPTTVLTDWQATHAATRPDMIHATAHLIADDYAAKGVADVEVRATAWVSMNGRPARLLLDPTVDLARYDRGGAPPGWILR